MPHRHPFLRRLGWHPLFAGGWFGLMLDLAYRGKSGPAFYAGLAFIGLWFGLSVFDRVTRHRWLDWLYGDELPGPGDDAGLA